MIGVLSEKKTNCTTAWTEADSAHHIESRSFDADWVLSLVHNIDAGLSVKTVSKVPLY